MASRRLLSSAVSTAAFNPSLLLTRTISTAAAAAAVNRLPRFSLLNNLTRFRAVSAIGLPYPTSSTFPSSLRAFATRHAYNDNQGNRPPKETILLDGCDFEHWLVVVQKPPEEWSRDEIIDHYIKTLAKVVGSEDEARMKIYSVSTRHYFAFGALVSEELSYKLKELEGVRWVLPDSYLDVKNKNYGGEPFVDGVAAPYDPKYHEEWVRNNQKAMERNRRNDRPRNADRSRNFERRQQQRPEGFQNNPPLPAGGNMGGAPKQLGSGPANPGYGQNAPPANPGYGQNMPPNNAGYGQNTGYARNMPPNNTGGAPPSYGGQGNPSAPPSYGGQGTPGAPPSYGGQGTSGAPPIYGGQGTPGAPPSYGGQGTSSAPPSYGGQGNPGAPASYGSQGNPGAPPSYGGQGNPGAPPSYRSQGNPGAPPPSYGGQGNPGAPSYGGQGNPGAPPNYGGQGSPGAPPNYGSQGNPGYSNNAIPNQQNYAHAPPPQSNVGGQPGGAFQSQDVPGRDLPKY